MRSLLGAVLVLGGCGGGDRTDDEDHRGLAELFEDLFSGGGLTEDEFMEEFADRYCAEFLRCNTSDTGCRPGEARPPERCELDQDAAEACLEGRYTCNREWPGFEYVLPPAECAVVCGGSARADGARPASRG